MGYDLCRVKTADEPFYLENISTNIYSIEELCFFLHEKVYLVDETVMNEKLCDWVRDSLGLKKLAKQLADLLDKESGVAAFVMPVFREIGYLAPGQMRSFQESLNKIEVQPEEIRHKLKGDYFVRSGMFGNAVNEYLQILDKQGEGNSRTVFYSQVWNNLGCAFARMFRFEDAADCFRKAWMLVHTKETLRKYVSVLPLYMTQEEYKDALASLGADNELIARMREYSASLAEDAKKQSRQKSRGGREDPAAALELLKEDYRRSAARRS